MNMEFGPHIMLEVTGHVKSHKRSLYIEIYNAILNL